MTNKQMQTLDKTKEPEAKIINIKAAVMIEAMILLAKEADMKYKLYCNASIKY